MPTQETTPRTKEAILQTRYPLDYEEASELLGRVRLYLPSNYGAALVTDNNLSHRVKITGTDNAGWTLDGYVIPRLASGNMFATEAYSSNLGVV